MDKEKPERNYVSRLRDLFALRKGKNPHYSLRAFARDLGVSPTSLSEVLNYKRDLARSNLIRISERLNWSPLEVQQVWDEIQGEAEAEISERVLLEHDQFKIMSDWYYFGILSLAKTRRCSAHPMWIARRLGISLMEAETALSRLIRLGLVKVRGRRLVRLAAPLTTTIDIPSSALKEFHKQHLQLAQRAVDEQAIENRSITTITMAIDVGKLPEAKRKIAGFRDQMGRFLEKGDRREVYTLAIQLFALSH